MSTTIKTSPIAAVALLALMLMASASGIDAASLAADVPAAAPAKGEILRRWTQYDQEGASTEKDPATGAVSPQDSGCNPGCLSEEIGDGQCNPECTTELCDFDSGDCGSSVCSPECIDSFIGDGICDPACLTAACEFDGGVDSDGVVSSETGDCGKDFCSPQCPTPFVGDGVCDPLCMTDACEDDKGDCDADCNTGCQSKWINDGFCDPSCYNSNCGYDGDDCDGFYVECAPGCQVGWLDDGVCDEVCYSAGCEYDFGDCGPRSGPYQFIDFPNLKDGQLFKDMLYTYKWDPISKSYSVCKVAGVTSTENKGPRQESFSDDSSVEYTLVKTPFEFFGKAYTKMYVASNGFITFGRQDGSFAPNDINRMPRVAALMTDLDPSIGNGGVHVKNTMNKVVVTWNRVRQVQANDLSKQVTMQIVLLKNTGDIQVYYSSVRTEFAAVIGLASGRPDADDTPETDFGSARSC